MENPPNQTIYINNLNEKVKKEGGCPGETQKLRELDDNLKQVHMHMRPMPPSGDGSEHVTVGFVFACPLLRRYCKIC